MLLQESLIKNQLEALHCEFEGQPKLDWYDEYLRVASTIDEWRFSTGDYFSPAPYEAERGGFPSPKLVKRKYKDVDEARWLGKYCAGFLGGQHLVTVMPGEPSIQALDADFFNMTEEGGVTILSISCKSMHRLERRSSRVIGLRRFINLGKDSKLYMGVGEGGACFAFLYEYLSDRPVAARGASNRTGSEARWEFHYDDAGELNKITSGPSVMWEKNR
ncbi:hypothetical protein [Burkholderia cepacia]|nr:hypothetical protein [Burkholderia cepacia]